MMVSKTRFIINSPFVIFTQLALFLLFSFIIFANPSSAYADTATCTWTGSGGDGNFSDAANWSGCSGAPQNGDSLVFSSPDTTPTPAPTGTPATAITNDISNLSVSSISNPNGLFTISGNPLTVTDSITATDVYLQSGLTFSDVILGGKVTIQGAVMDDINLNSNTLVMYASDGINALDGTGNVIDENGGGYINYDGHQWTGTLTIVSGEMYINPTPTDYDTNSIQEFGSSTNTIIIDQGANLWLEDAGSNFYTIPQNITMGGTTALYIYGYDNDFGGAITFPGTITLTSDTTIGGVESVIISGPLLGKYTLTHDSLDNGIIYICSSDNESLTPSNGCTAPTPMPTPIPTAPLLPPPPPQSTLPIYPVMNTDETPPDGVWFRNSPHTADTNKITGDGIYAGDRVQLECYAYGDAVGPYNDSLWYYVSNVTRPKVPGTGAPNVGYLNAHYINDGKVANQVDAGVPPCGNVPSYTPPSQVVQQSHSTSSSSTNTINNGEPINMVGGNYLVTRQEFSVPGRDLPVNFSLSYNSENASQSGVLGYGWTHSYLVSLAPESNGDAIVQNEDGRLDLYTASTGGSFTPPPDIHDSLKTTANGYQLTRKNHVIYNFNANGQLLTIVSPNGNTQTLSYNAGNELASLTDTVGRTFTFTYDNSNHLITVMDPAGRSAVYTYDTNGNLATATDPAGNVTTYHYDANHEIIGITDPRGNSAVTNTYDANGRVIFQTNALGKTISLAYTPGQTVFTDQKGNKTTYFYDGNLRITKIQDANGGMTTYTYDSNDNQNSITDPNGNKTSLTYDTNGNLTQLTKANGGVITYTYDGNNNLTGQKDPLGNLTSFSYDSHNNLLQKTDAAGHKTTFAYDSFGDLLKTTDSLGHATTFTYDNQGNITAVTNPLGNSTKISYDTIGRPDSITDASGHISQYTYDALDRLIQQKDALGDSTSYVYDADGNQTKVTDPNNHSTSYSYNAANELTSVLDALGHTTIYTYDNDGNLTGSTDANQHATTYSYDVLNRLITSTNALGQKTVRTYDADGNLLSSTDPNGHTTTYAYDPVNELTTVNYADKSSVTYAYDADGNRTQMVDGTGKTVYSYNVLGNLTSVTSPGNKTVSYTYDADSNQATMTYPDGNKETYSYNGVNQITSAEDWNNHTTTYLYTSTGNVKQINYPNGAVISYAYDNANRPITVTNTPKLGPGTSYAYTFDADGNRTSVDQKLNISTTSNNILQNILQSLPNLGDLYQNITKNGQFSFSNPATTTFYTYDALNRLVSAKGLTNNQGFTYDPVGNRLSQTNNNQTTTYSYNVGDEMLKAGNTTYAYDANGNRIQGSTNGIVTNYAYNDANELTSVSNRISTLDKYVYDGDGNRVQTTANSITTNDIWNVNGTMPQLLSQTALNRTTDYQYGNNLIAADSSQPNSQNYYQYDGLGNIVGQTNEQGMQVSSYSYDAYGEPESGAQAIGQPLQNPFGYSGQQQDPTGLIYMRARYYDPNNGTFMSRDTYPAALNNPTTINRYAYVQDNPINYSDPMGLCSINPFSSSSCVKTVTSTVKNAVSKTASYVANNAGTVTSFAVGAATGIACTIGTAGAGAILCGALAGLVTEEATELVTGNLSVNDLILGTALGGVGGLLPNANSIAHALINIGGNVILNLLSSPTGTAYADSLSPSQSTCE